MFFKYIIFYSFVDETTGLPRHARAELKLPKAITSDDLLAFEGEQVAAGDSKAVVTGIYTLGVGGWVD